MSMPMQNAPPYICKQNLSFGPEGQKSAASRHRSEAHNAYRYKRASSFIIPTWKSSKNAERDI
jgi:hypothetical protein